MCVRSERATGASSVPFGWPSHLRRPRVRQFILCVCNFSLISDNKGSVNQFLAAFFGPCHKLYMTLFNEKGRTELHLLKRLFFYSHMTLWPIEFYTNSEPNIWDSSALLLSSFYSVYNKKIRAQSVVEWLRLLTCNPVSTSALWVWVPALTICWITVPTICPQSSHIVFLFVRRLH